MCSCIKSLLAKVRSHEHCMERCTNTEQLNTPMLNLAHMIHTCCQLYTPHNSGIPKQATKVICCLGEPPKLW